MAVLLRKRHGEIRSVTYVHLIQIQYRPAQPKTSWLTINDLYNRSIQRALINQLSSDDTYKFRLIGLDAHRQQLVISATKRFSLQPVRPSLHTPWVEINDAWIEFRLKCPKRKRPCRKCLGEKCPTQRCSCNEWSLEKCPRSL